MLHSLKNLRDFAIVANDGQVGHVKYGYFDDATWVVRYLVAETDKTWLDRQRVLISPISVHSVDEKSRSIHLTVTREQVKHSPDIDTDRPVSRQREVEFYRFYDYPTYWQGLGLWGYGGYPYELNSAHDLYDPIWAGGPPVSVYEDRAENEQRTHPGDPHLRSADEVEGYAIHASDGDIGKVEDLIVDDQSWSIRYLVVKTGHWWNGTRVLIVPRAITDVSWSKSHVSVALAREAVKQAPHFKSMASLNLATRPG